MNAASDPKVIGVEGAGDPSERPVGWQEAGQVW